MRVALLRRADGVTQLEVTDSGPGIAPDLRGRVFESYYRIPGSPGGGSGLGLAIVREVALRHAGRVEIAEGDNDIGTRVVVSFDASLERPTGQARVS